MLPYKSINIESFDEIQYQLTEILKKTNNKDTTESFVVDKDYILAAVPKLNDFLIKNNLEWGLSRFFTLKSNDAMPIHIDGNDQYPKYLALNLPLFGYNNSYMQWWNNVSITEIVDTKYYGDRIKMLDGHDKSLTYSLELTSPHLVQVNIPHNVVNLNNHTRAIFSMRFNPEPLHLWY